VSYYIFFYLQNIYVTNNCSTNTTFFLFFPPTIAETNTTILPSLLPIRPGSTVASISEHRRKEILAQLASERVGRRGFASEREVRVSEEAKAAATIIPSDSSIANNPRTSAVQAALQSAASAAVNSALNKALQSLSTVGKSDSEPIRTTAAPLVSALRDLGNSSSSSSSSSAVIESPSRSEKDKLVARLIAERRERFETDTRGGSLPVSIGNASAGAEYIRLGTSRVLPPVPPVVAALQAQAAAAAAAASAALATATVSAQIVQNNLNTSRLGHSGASNFYGKNLQENKSLEESDPKPKLIQSPQVIQKEIEAPITMTVEQGDISKYSSKSRSTGGDERSFKRKSKEDLRKEREAALYGECTFKPTILNTKSSSSSSIVVSSSGSGESALDARFDALAQSKNKAWEERERLRKESEKETMESECTFQPNASSTIMGAHNSSMNRRSSSPPNTNVSRSISQPKSNLVRSTSPLPTRIKSPTPIVQRSKTPLPAEKGRFASEYNQQQRTEAPQMLKSLQSPSLGSPSKPGSPLLWERSLARQYLEGSAGAITAATAKARAIAQSQQALQAMEPILPANTQAAPLRPTTTPRSAPPPPPPSNPTPTAAPPSIPQWKAAPPTAIVMPSVLREPELEAVPAVVTRLYMEAEVRNSERAKAKAAAEKAQLAEFRFKPTINATSTALAADQRRPVHERTAEVQQAKEERIHRLRMEGILSNQDLTFKPKINEVSERIAIMKLRQQGLPVSDAPGFVGESKEGPDAASTKRMTLVTSEYEKRREARTKAAAEAELRAFSFKPRLNKNSEKIVEQKVGEDGGGFMARQVQVAEAQKRHREALLAQLKAEDECKFKPDIGNAEEFLALTRPDLVTESSNSRINRMSVEESEKRRAAQADAEKEYYNQFNYQPEINQLSKRRGRAHTVEEHYKDEEGHRARLRAKLQAEEEFKRQHPFKPTLVAADLAPKTASGDDEAAADEAAIAEGKMPLRLAVATDPDRISARVNAHMKGKAARSEAAKRLLDYEKLKECTFQPETDRSARSLAKLKEQVAADGGVVVVRGLGRYLELKELTRKLDEDKEQREREAFSKPGFSWPDGMTKPPTVPQPFHLSSADTALAHLAQKEIQIAKEKAIAEASAEAAAIAEERRIAALRVSNSSSKKKENKQQQQQQQQQQQSSSARTGMHPSQQHILLQQALENDDYNVISDIRKDSSLLTGPALNITRL
jgi:hypothetical protein